MSKFEKTSDQRKDYGSAEDQIASVNEQLKNAANLDPDKLMELAQQRKALEGTKTELIGDAQMEAGAEEAERNAYDEAKAQDEAFEQKKAAEAALKFAQEAAAQAEADAKAYAEKLAALQGGKIETGQTDKAGETPEQTKERWKKAALDVVMGERKLERPNKQETIEDIYGMNIEALAKLVQGSRSPFPEGIKPNDPQVDKKMEEFYAHWKKQDQARVLLFDRVFAGVASEEEIKIAEKHAANKAKENEVGVGRGPGISSFGHIPKSWYANERIANAIAGTGEGNNEWVESVRKNYSTDQLMKGGFEKIDKDGFAHEYNIKGY